MGQNDYTKGDAAKETNVSVKEVSETWHSAKDDAMRAGELPERHEAKVDKGYRDLARDAYNSDSSSGSGK